MNMIVMQIYYTLYYTLMGMFMFEVHQWIDRRLVSIRGQKVKASKLPGDGIDTFVPLKSLKSLKGKLIAVAPD